MCIRDSYKYEYDVWGSDDWKPTMTYKNIDQVNALSEQLGGGPIGGYYSGPWVISQTQRRKIYENWDKIISKCSLLPREKSALAGERQSIINSLAPVSNIK